MTKKDLERRNQFLLLQLKIIHEMLEKVDCQNKQKLMETIGAIQYHTEADTIKSKIKFIEEYNQKYNFYNKTMNIKDYE